MYVELSCFLTLLSRLTITSFSIANFVDVVCLVVLTDDGRGGAARLGVAYGNRGAMRPGDQGRRHKKTPLPEGSEVRGGKITSNERRDCPLGQG